MRPSASPTPLSAVHPGERRRVVRLTGHVAELACEGVLPGAELRVASRAMPGGPVVVQVGRARLAISADVAATVLTTPVEGPDPNTRAGRLA
jgi:Fe2+ transport system protein FeoA